MSSLKGKVAVVTGGASGIGLGIAGELVARGATVVIADVEAGALERAAAEIGATGILTDVTDPASVAALAEDVVAQFGKVDIVCNNAGVGPMALLADMTLADWRWLIDVNLYGVIHGVWAFLPKLEANPDGGFILNTSSIGGLVAGLHGAGGYSVTKFGVTALTESLAAELATAGSKVGAGLLCPGPTRSNIARSHRNRPAHLAPGALADQELDDSADAFEGGIDWKPREETGRIAVDGIEARQLYILTHPHISAPIRARHAAIEAVLV